MSGTNALYVVMPPDGGFGWVIVGATFLTNFIADGVMYTFGVFLEELCTDLAVKKGQIALIGSVTCACYHLAGPFTSALVNRYGFRLVGILGSVIASLSYTSAAFCHSIPTMIITNGVFAGIGLGMIYVPSAIVVGFYFDKRRALASGLSTSGSGMGTLALSPVMGILIHAFGWRTTYFVISGLILLTSLCALTYRPLKPFKIRPHPGPLTPSLASTRTSEYQDILGRHPKFLGESNKNFPTNDQIIDPKYLHKEDIYLDYSDEDSDERSANIVMLKDKETVSNFKDDERTSCWSKFRLCPKREKKMSGLPIYRDDIFFHQSLMLLPMYSGKNLRTKLDRDQRGKNNIDYHMSVTRVRSFKQPQTKRSNWFRCPTSITRALCTMLDMGLLRSPAFQVFSLSGLVVDFGYMIPLLYIQDRAVQKGIDEKIAMWLISTIGLSNTVGRLICGVLPLVTRISLIYYSFISLVIGGVFTMVSGIDALMEFKYQFLYASVFGFCGACVATLRPVIAVELFGLEHLTNAFGLQMLFMGIGTFCGIFTSGVLLDKTNNYNYVFVLSGSCIAGSGILLTSVKKIREWEKKRGILI